MLHLLYRLSVSSSTNHSEEFLPTTTPSEQTRPEISRSLFRWSVPMKESIWYPAPVLTRQHQKRFPRPSAGGVPQRLSRNPLILAHYSSFGALGQFCFNKHRLYTRTKSSGKCDARFPPCCHHSIITLLHEPLYRYLCRLGLTYM